MADNLRRLTGLALPPPGQWREAALLADAWDRLELGVAAGPLLLWYRWSTSA